MFDGHFPIDPVLLAEDLANAARSEVSHDYNADGLYAALDHLKESTDSLPTLGGEFELPFTSTFTPEPLAFTPASLDALAPGPSLRKRKVSEHDDLYGQDPRRPRTLRRRPAYSRSSSDTSSGASSQDYLPSVASSSTSASSSVPTLAQFTFRADHDSPLGLSPVLPSLALRPPYPTTSYSDVVYGEQPATVMPLYLPFDATLEAEAAAMMSYFYPEFPAPALPPPVNHAAHHPGPVDQNQFCFTPAALVPPSAPCVEAPAAETSASAATPAEVFVLCPWSLSDDPTDLCNALIPVDVIKETNVWGSLNYHIKHTHLRGYGEKDDVLCRALTPSGQLCTGSHKKAKIARHVWTDKHVVETPEGMPLNGKKPCGTCSKLIGVRGGRSDSMTRHQPGSDECLRYRDRQGGKGGKQQRKGKKRA